MTLYSQLLASASFLMILAAIFYVIFGQVTVRKLRKNPETKKELGFEYVSGWDIINVAQALALPRSWSRKLEKSPLSSMHASSDLLFKHTNKFDKILAIFFYWLFSFSGLCLITLVLLNWLGAFN